MNFNTTSLTKELRRFFEDNDIDDGRAPTKSAFSQARLKLKHSCFIEFNERYTENYYSQDTLVKKWRGYRLLSVDGSLLQLPRTKPITEYFGEWNPINGDPCPMGRVSILYDMLNDLTVDALLSPKKSGERALAHDQINRNLKANDLLLMDRGYPCFWLAASILEKGSHFIARVETSKWNFAKELIQSKHNDVEVILEPTYNSQNRMHEFDIEDRDHLKLRAVKVKLESGEWEVLLTSLTDKNISVDVFKSLYGLRWPIEEKIKVYKCRVEIEKFSGKSVESVLQDFHAKILSTNLGALLLQSANCEAEHRYRNREKKYKVNVTESISIMKRRFIGVFFNSRIEFHLQRIIMQMSEYVEIIRPGRKFSREKTKRNKKWNLCYSPIS